MWRNLMSPPCKCQTWCGDVPEVEDPDGCCKGLRRAPEPPLVEFVLVHRDDYARFLEEERIKDAEWLEHLAAHETDE